MRRLLSLFFVLALLVTACSKPEPDNPKPTPDTPKQETVTLSPGTNTAPVITTAGGSVNVSFTASAAWSASIINTKADSWCSVSPTSGVAGSASITITVKENTTPDNRSASVVIISGTATQTIKVEQKQKNSLTVTASSFEVSADGGEIKVATKSNVTFTHTISTDAQSWIKAVETKALKDSTLIFEIDVNKEVEKRSGQIYLTSGDLKDTVNVYQAGETPTIVVGQNEYVLKSEGESFEIEVASNVNATMNMVYPQGVEAWIVENTSKSISTNKFYFTAKANEGYDSRSAMIVFSNAENNLADTVTVTQAQKDAIVLAKSEYEFDKKGGNLDFEIQTNVDIKVTIADSCKSWITQVETRALETKKLFFNIAACDTLNADRTGTITLSGGNVTQTIKVKQSGLKEILEAERAALIEFYKATGGDNWTNNTNWCSDKPVSEWYGVVSTEDGYNGRVTILNLDYNNLSGNFEECIEALKPLKQLHRLSMARAGSFTGKIPESIGDFSELNYLYLSNLGLTGDLPQSIGKLKKLKYLSLGNEDMSGGSPCNQLTGTLQPLEPIFENLIHFGIRYNKFEGNLPEFSDNMRCFDVSRNRFTGKIPESHIKAFDKNNKGDMYDTEYGCRYFISFNNLNGTIPASMLQHKNWIIHWYHIVAQNKGYGFDRVDLPAFNNIVKCYDGSMLNLKEEYEKNKYTLIFRWEPDCPVSQTYKLPIYELYSKYKDKGLSLIATSAMKYDMQYMSLLTSFMPDVKCFWETTAGTNGADESYDNNPYHVNRTNFFLFRYGVFPTFYVIDNKGNIIFISSGNGAYCENPTIAFPDTYEQYHHNCNDIFNYVAKLFGDEEFVPNGQPSYMSTDFSKDGTVVTLQKATEGKGIDVVLMGDGYSDRQIESGLYESDMKVLYDNLFTEEPYKSFKHLFNVYYVNVVSATEGYDFNNTALKGWFGEKTYVGGDDEKCFEYAQTILSDEQMDEALIIVGMNAYAHSGTCYMYQSSNKESDWGAGASISYFTKGTADGASTVEQLLHHEANGHGFAKLGDEYAYEDYGQIPSDEVESHKAMGTYGWWKNVDFTNDPAQVKWAKFLADTRYKNDGLGVFEGGLTYWTGVWRPTENSIMNDNTGGFNAPSREAIYYRIHKLAYGADWQYDYEKFVEWDAINRKKEAQTKSMPLVLDPEKNKLPHTPPVVIPHSWREAR